MTRDIYVFMYLLSQYDIFKVYYFKMNANTGEKPNSESQNFDNLKYNIADNTQWKLSKFFDVNFQNFGTPYLLRERCYDFLGNTSHNCFSILHLNIRSIKKNFRKFQINFNLHKFYFQCFLKYSWMI